MIFLLKHSILFYTSLKCLFKKSPCRLLQKQLSRLLPPCLGVRLSSCCVNFIVFWLKSRQFMKFIAGILDTNVLTCFVRSCYLFNYLAEFINFLLGPCLQPRSRKGPPTEPEGRHATDVHDLTVINCYYVYQHLVDFHE